MQFLINRVVGRNFWTTMTIKKNKEVFTEKNYSKKINKHY